jgi:ABC-type multidrug transport system fused ATPase/permease subunit
MGEAISLRCSAARRARVFRLPTGEGVPGLHQNHSRRLPALSAAAPTRVRSDPLSERFYVPPGAETAPKSASQARVFRPISCISLPLRPMGTVQPFPLIYRRVWRQVSARRRVQLGILLLLMLTSAAAEVFSIGAVLPFLGLLTAPERVLDHTLIQPIVRAAGLSSREDILLFFSAGFAAAALLSAALRLLAMWSQVRMANAIGADLGIRAYERTLYQPYSVHLACNSSEILSGLTKANGLASVIVQPTLNVLSGAVILLGLLGTMFAIDPLVALICIGGFGGIYAGILQFTRRRLAEVSQTAAFQVGRITKATQEGLGGIRDVLIDGSQGTYARLYKSSIRPLQRAGAWVAFIDNSPRVVIEALGMTLIAGLSYSLARQSGGGTNPVLVLGSLALGAQRMLPVLQMVYSNVIKIRGAQVSVQDALDLLEQPLPAHLGLPPATPLDFRQALEVRELHFRYSPSAPWVLRGLNLRIPRGSRVGFIGATGSGKSTLIDILMGLLSPVEGQVLIDGRPVFPDQTRGWQAHLAHVPQAIYLADISIAENIAFGVPVDQIDRDRVRAAARQAQIADAIESWTDGYDTLVGERGVRLSGGQRQRVGIARALYKRADVIVFDEATSALDNQTEAAVMEAIEGLHSDLTLLIVAHRLTTLRGCDLIVELEQGRIRRVGSYQEIVGEQTVAAVRTG